MGDVIQLLLTEIANQMATLISGQASSSTDHWGKRR